MNTHPASSARSTFGKKIIRLALLSLMAIILTESCSSKAACGTRKQHNYNAKKMHRMAPDMAFGK